MKVSEFLQRVLDRLGPNGEHWTGGAFARDAKGDRTSINWPDACFWCFSGAVFKEAAVITTEPVTARKALLVLERDGHRIVSMNDNAFYGSGLSEPLKDFSVIRDHINTSIAYAKQREAEGTL